MCSFEYSAADFGRRARDAVPAEVPRGRKLDPSTVRAYGPRLLLDLDCHETQMTWQTLDLLVEGGCDYVADWVVDDQPFDMTLAGGRLTAIPYSLEINDLPQFNAMHRTPDEFAAMIRRTFDVLYREGAESGRVMAIALHPFVIGVPHRIDALAQALDYVLSHERVWVATGAEIVDAYRSAAAG